MIGIIGGGLSGVSLQHFLQGPSEILEKESRVGGLCRTFERDGFRYDLGGHILFSKDEAAMAVIRAILADNLHGRRRENKILFNGRYVKYPFENDLGALDKQDIFECLMGYLDNHNPSPTNFKEWMYYTFGNGIAEKYLLPYNAKIWKMDPSEMSMEWVERVPRPPMQDVVKSALGIATEGYVHQLQFLYPAAGGIESLVHAFRSPDAALVTGYEVRSIRKQGSDWVVSDGHSPRTYRRLVATSPLTQLVGMLEGVPAEVLDAAAKLRFNAVRVVLIGVNNASLMDKSAIYIPDPAMATHRVCFMGYFSGANVPAGRSSLIAEVTTHEGTALHGASDAALTEMLVGQLDKAGILHAKDVVTTDVTNCPFGYVVYDHPYSRNVKIVRDYVRGLGIELHGRFAEFDYINMDEVIRRSIRLAGQLKA